MRKNLKLIFLHFKRHFMSFWGRFLRYLSGTSGVLSLIPWNVCKNVDYMKNSDIEVFTFWQTFHVIGSDFWLKLWAFYRRFREMSIKMLIIQLISKHIGIMINSLKNSASFQELIFFFFSTTYVLDMRFTENYKMSNGALLGWKNCTVE